MDYHQQRFLQQLAKIVGEKFPDLCEKMEGEYGIAILLEGPSLRKSHVNALSFAKTFK